MRRHGAGVVHRYRGCVTEHGDFTQWLRDRTDEQLSALLAQRPELMTPVPADVTALAARAGSVSLLGRALDRLDAFTTQVVEALLVLPEPATYDELAAAFDVARTDDREAVGPALRVAVDRLHELALAWGGDRELHALPGLRQVIMHPAGLGPPVAELLAGCSSQRLAGLAADLELPADASPAEALTDPDRLAGLFAAAGKAAGEAVRKLVWGPPVGTVADADRPVRVATAASPIEELLARGLLMAAGPRTVVLPREVALYLRHGVLLESVRPLPPELTGTARDPGSCDSVAAGAAFAVVRAVDDLLDRWANEPPAVLRNGGLGIRDLRRAAELLDVDETVAALYAETAHAAGLLAPGDAADGSWLPTPAYDVWRGRELPDRWLTLVRAWLTMPRVPALVGTRDGRDRICNALADGVTRTSAPALRGEVLDALATASPGVAVRTEALRGYLDWQRPRRQGSLRDLVVESTPVEAGHLGVVGRGALAGYIRAVRDGDDATALGALAALLPDPVDHVLVQADLTAVAPGPLTRELARDLDVLADVESTGGGVVYRFTETSMRRAFDAGWTAREVLDLLTAHSRTPVPQPLRYLITDVGRRHGRLRVGTATAYVRCEDETVLDELLADPRSAGLRLRRLAPTVLAGKTSRAALVEALRALGFAPVAESLDGDLEVARSPRPRAAEARNPRSADRGRPPGGELAPAAVRALRAGDEAATTARRPLAAPHGAAPRSPASATIAALSDAAVGGRRVWIGYLDAQGTQSSRIVEPARVDGGYLTAYDATRAAVHRFALHRITGVAELTEPAPVPPS